MVVGGELEESGRTVWSSSALASKHGGNWSVELAGAELAWTMRAFAAAAFDQVRGFDAHAAQCSIPCLQIHAGRATAHHWWAKPVAGPQRHLGMHLESVVCTTGRKWMESSPLARYGCASGALQTILSCAPSRLPAPNDLPLSIPPAPEWPGVAARRRTRRVNRILRKRRVAAVPPAIQVGADNSRRRAMGPSTELWCCRPARTCAELASCTTTTLSRRDADWTTDRVRWP